MSIPATDKIKPRPVWRRACRRMEGLPLDPPTEQEIRDAIAVLRDSPTWEKLDLIFESVAHNMGISDLLTTGSGLRYSLDPLVEEAERIHQECSE